MSSLLIVSLQVALLRTSSLWLSAEFEAVKRNALIMLCRYNLYNADTSSGGDHHADFEYF
jgi:hypothetical protein